MGDIVEGRPVIRCHSCKSLLSPTDVGAWINDHFQHVSSDLSDLPEYAMALGVLAANNSKVDESLALIASHLMRASPWHARVALFSILNNKARIDMLVALAGHMVGSTEFHPRVISILKTAKTLAEGRNKFVHAQWFVSTTTNDVYLVDQVGSPAKSSYRKVGVDEIDALSIKTRALISEISTFIGDYSQAYPLFLYDDAPEALREKFHGLRSR